MIRTAELQGRPDRVMHTAMKSILSGLGLETFETAADAFRDLHPQTQASRE